jgi:hypothetical protein
LIERAYWALTINALEPVNQDECYGQDDIDILAEELGDFLNG